MSGAAIGIVGIVEVILSIGVVGLCGWALCIVWRENVIHKERMKILKIFNSITYEETVNVNGLMMKYLLLDKIRKEWNK